jgi:quercetin dioxygenase-like cupin family protein
MRLVITGVDERGRSCVVSDSEAAFAGGAELGGMSLAGLFATATAPPPPRPTGQADHVDLGVGPGLISWMAVDYAPGSGTHLHHTDSVEFEIVLAGSVELTLGDGVHHLVAGTCVVMNGVDHQWTAGPDGCRLSVLVVGTEPPGNAAT